MSGAPGDPAGWLARAPLDPAAVAARVEGPDCGAVVLFLGNVRDHHDGQAVERLDYTGYEVMAAKALERIAAEVGAAHGARVAVAHRLGALQPGETSVVIAAASPRRDAAFTASRETLERLKREVPIWKREHYGDGTSRWREEEPLAPPRVE